MDGWAENRAAPAREDVVTARQAPDRIRRCQADLVAWSQAVTDRFLTAECRSDPERGRRARLVTRFGFVGFIFGTFFALFYLGIGHPWGAGIVTLCSVLFAVTPWIMKCRDSERLGGELLSAVMLLGFMALCGVEGGMHGHAIAWLATVPLCALLLVGKESARRWAYGSAVSAGWVVVLGLAGVRLPTLYPPDWHYVVTATGYLSLIAFMFILGLVFENTRLRAFNDVETARRTLADANQKLVQLNQEKNEFLGIAAHDLKNPLSTIIAYAGLLKYSNTPQELEEVAERITTDVRRMTHLIDDLLDANAIEEGRFTSDIRPCALVPLALRSADFNRVNATRKNISLSVVRTDDPWALADENAAAQILDNLVSNAVKYSPHGAHVRIVVSGGTDGAQVAVQDQGPGLSAEDQKRLFRKFTRLTARPTGGESSNGLGLSIVKRLAESMSGTVACQSTLGHGCVFTLRLPRAEVPPARRAASDQGSGSNLHARDSVPARSPCRAG